MQTFNEWNPYSNESIWSKFLKIRTAVMNDDNIYLEFINFFEAQLNLIKTSNVQQNELDEIYLMRSYTNGLQNHNNRVSWSLYYILCIAGGLYALCSGFDGMVSVLSLVVPELFLGVVILLGALSALSALGIFIARDKPSIMESIELSHNPYHNLVDEYIYSLNLYNSSQLNSKIEEKKPNTQFLIETKSAKILDQIFKNKEELNHKVKDSWLVQIQANAVMFIGGVLFFSDGFFVGENVALFLSSYLSLTSFGFTLGISLIMGIFALAAYWYVERSSLKDYLYDNVSTDECLRKDAAEMNRTNLSLLNFFDAQKNSINQLSSGYVIA